MTPFTADIALQEKLAMADAIILMYRKIKVFVKKNRGQNDFGKLHQKNSVPSYPSVVCS